MEKLFNFDTRIEISIALTDRENKIRANAEFCRKSYVKYKDYHYLYSALEQQNKLDRVIQAHAQIDEKCL